MSSSDDPDHKKKRANVSIRQMEIDDIAIIFHLGEQLFTAREVPNLYRTWDEYELISLFQSDAEFCLVAEVEDRIVGFALGTTITKSRSAWKYGHLVWLGVDPALRRQGLAEKLFSHFQDLMLEDGVRMLVVDSHPDPYRDPDTVAAGYVNEAANLISRSQMRDAAFSLLSGTPYTARVMYDPLQVGEAGTWVKRPVTFDGRDAVARFSDSRGYYPGAELVIPTPKDSAKKWMTRQWDASVVIPSKKPYGMKAPGYTAGTELLSNCAKASDGSLDCRPVNKQTSHSMNGGTGNPGDVGGQYGWNAQVLSQSDKQGAVQIWNGTTDPTLVATSAATFLANAVSPGQIVTFFGANIGPASLESLQLTAGGLVSTTLGGTRVLFDGVAAPLIYTYATQVSAVVPYAVKSKTYTEVQIEYQGRLTKKLVLPVAPNCGNTPLVARLGAVPSSTSSACVRRASCWAISTMRVPWIAPYTRGWTPFTAFFLSSTQL